MQLCSPNTRIVGTTELFVSPILDETYSDIGRVCWLAWCLRGSVWCAVRSPVVRRCVGPCAGWLCRDRWSARTCCVRSAWCCRSRKARSASSPPPTSACWSCTPALRPDQPPNNSLLFDNISIDIYLFCLFVYSLARKSVQTIYAYKFLRCLQPTTRMQQNCTRHCPTVNS